MSLSSEDWQKINGCLLRLYRELDSEKLNRLIMEILEELVPTGSVVLNYIKPPNHFSNQMLPPNLATPEQVAAVGRYAHQSPIANYYLATQERSWKMITDFMPLEDFYKLDLYRHALQPLDTNYQIGGLLATLDGAIHLITLQRKDHGFTENDRKILNALHPHLVTSYINALTFSRSKESLTQLKAAMETAPGAYGYFNPDGIMAWMQPKAQEWLQEFFPHEVKNDNIPHSIQNLLVQSEARGNTPEHLEILNRHERLTAMLTMPPMGGWLLRLERKPLQAAPHFHPLPQLSERKNDVLQWMLEGKRNGEIATILHLSPRTVEKHVAEIIQKFNCENRATAIILAMGLCNAISQGMATL